MPSTSIATSTPAALYLIDLDTTAPAETAREHRWSHDAQWAPWGGNLALPILTRHCTRTDCGITEAAHREAPSPCRGSDDEFQMTYQADEMGAVIVSVESGFELRWTDYASEDRTAGFTTLSTAVAGLATLIYCLETNPDRVFTDPPEQFAAVAAAFHRANTA